MKYNKHRLYSRGKRYYGGGFFADAIKSIAKKGLQILGEEAKHVIEDKSRDFIRNKMKQIIGSGLKRLH